MVAGARVYLMVIWKRKEALDRPLKQEAVVPADDYGSLRREYAALAPRYNIRWKSYIAASVRETLKRAHIRSHDRVLDVGCGTGELLKAISFAVPEARLAGIDVSLEMLKIARSKSSGSVDMREGCAEALPFEDGVCDVVVSSSAFHFFRYPAAALTEMHRVLRVGGRIVLTDWCSDYLACRLYDLILRLFSPGHFRAYNSKKISQLIYSEGFSEINIERYKISWLWGMMTVTAKKAPAATTAQIPPRYHLGKQKP